MDTDALRSVVFEAVEASLSAQLKAIRSLRSGQATHSLSSPTRPTKTHKGRSHIDMTYAILLEAQQPLHVTEIISRIAARFDTKVDRESLVSALSKRVARQDRFTRTDKNTFTLLPNNLR